MYFDGGVFIGGILIYDILSDWSLVEIYRLGLYILADFLFMSLTAIVHAATYKDVPDAVALELPLLYILVDDATYLRCTLPRLVNSFFLFLNFVCVVPPRKRV